MRVLPLLIAVLLVGCARPQPATQGAHVDPPPSGGGFVACHSSQAQQYPYDLRAESTNDSGGRDPGIYRLDHDSFLWVWANYHDTLRQDRVSRILSVDAYREPAFGAPLALCARVDITSPQDVDGARRSYAVAALLHATAPLPNGTIRVIVNWLAGCSCDTPPTGNASADFE